MNTGSTVQTASSGDRAALGSRWKPIVPFLGALILLCALEILTIDVLASVRAYVTGESLFSKSQKDAIFCLERYARSGDADDFEAYRRAIAVPLGDRQARIELDRPDPDLQRVRAGFVQGGNHPDDTGGMIRLYRHFRGLEPVSRAIAIWVEADQEIARLVDLGDRLHVLVAAGERDSPAIRVVTDSLHVVNSRLSNLERRFSDTLGMVSRATHGMVLVATVVASLLLALFALFSSLLMTRFLRRQVANERALRESGQRWDMAVAAARIGLVDWDLGSRRATLDARAAALFGVDPGEGGACELERIEQRVHPDDLARVRASLQQAIASGAPLEMRYRVVDDIGQVRHHELNARVGQPADASARVLGIVRDVTGDIVREQLRLDKEAAERASAAKTEFLSRVSHELRTPLNAVLGFAQLLITDHRSPLDPTQHQRVEHIRRAGTHLLALVDDMLDLVTIESGEDKLDKRSVDLAAVLEDSRRWVTPQAKAAGVAIVLKSAHANVRADARRLRQVLANLLSNAVKYNRPEGTVTLSLVSQPDERWRVLSVRDTGRGLSQEQLARMFEPFNRLGAEHEGIPGTGIGLNIARRLLERMGGRLEVNSTPGEGSDFRVWLPAAPDDVAVRPDTLFGALAQDIPDSHGDRLDVLYIEDNPVNTVLVEQALSTRANVRLRLAETGTEGLAAALEFRPDVLLIDMELPDFDGFEVLSRVRAEPTLNAARCIALSANAMPDYIARARAAGFDDYWTKPIDFKRFLVAIDALTHVRA